MRNFFRAGIIFAAVIFCVGIAQAEDFRALFPQTAKLNKDMAVLYFNSKSRFDLNILAEFIKDCGVQGNVACICVETSDIHDSELIKTFEKTENETCMYRGKTDEALPRMEFINDGAVTNTIEKDGNFTGQTPVYLSYTAGDIDAKTLNMKIKAVESAEMYKKIVPRMNFVLMLAKKGQVNAALKELENIDQDKLDDKGKLLLGETYIRLQAPEKAVTILEKCEDIECVFYLGIAQCMAGNHSLAIKTFLSLQGKYKDENKLKYYLKQAYIKEGDVQHADEIRLPENYNIDSQ